MWCMAGFELPDIFSQVIYFSAMHLLSCIFNESGWALWPNMFILGRAINQFAAICVFLFRISLQWCHNGQNTVPNHQPHDYLYNRLFRRRSKKIPKLRATGLCAGNGPGTGEFPAQMASNAENVSIRWRHHALLQYRYAYTSWATSPATYINPHFARDI